MGGDKKEMLDADRAEFPCLYRHERSLAFTAVWQQYRDVLYRSCVRWMGGNTTEAEDALSRAMLKAWEKVLEGKGARANFKAWLMRLTYNVCVDIHRERNRGFIRIVSWEALAADEKEQLASFEETPVAAATRRQLELILRGSIDELPDRMREPAILYFEEELSHLEIASQLGISYDNVRKRISLGRAILRERLSEYLAHD